MDMRSVFQKKNSEKFKEEYYKSVQGLQQPTFDLKKQSQIQQPNIPEKRVVSSNFNLFDSQPQQTQTLGIDNSLLFNLDRINQNPKLALQMKIKQEQSQEQDQEMLAIKQRQQERRELLMKNQQTFLNEFNQISDNNQQQNYPQITENYLNQQKQQQLDLQQQILDKQKLYNINIQQNQFQYPNQNLNQQFQQPNLNQTQQFQQLNQNQIQRQLSQQQFQNQQQPQKSDVMQRFEEFRKSRTQNDKNKVDELQNKLEEIKIVQQQKKSLSQMQQDNNSIPDLFAKKDQPILQDFSQGDQNSFAVQIDQNQLNTIKQESQPNKNINESHNIQQNEPQNKQFFNTFNNNFYENQNDENFNSSNSQTMAQQNNYSSKQEVEEPSPLLTDYKKAFRKSIVQNKIEPKLQKRESQASFQNQQYNRQASQQSFQTVQLHHRGSQLNYGIMNNASQISNDSQFQIDSKPRQSFVNFKQKRQSQLIQHLIPEIQPQNEFDKISSKGSQSFSEDCEECEDYNVMKRTSTEINVQPQKLRKSQTTNLDEKEHVVIPQQKRQSIINKIQKTKGQRFSLFQQEAVQEVIQDNSKIKQLFRKKLVKDSVQKLVIFFKQIISYKEDFVIFDDIFKSLQDKRLAYAFQIIKSQPKQNPNQIKFKSVQQMNNLQFNKVQQQPFQRRQTQNNQQQEVQTFQRRQSDLGHNQIYQNNQQNQFQYDQNSLQDSIKQIEFRRNQLASNRDSQNNYQSQNQISKEKVLKSRLQTMNLISSSIGQKKYH